MTLNKIESLNRWLFLVFKVIALAYITLILVLGWVAFFEIHYVKMKTYTCQGFKGHWPIGTAAVVLANDAETAAQTLNKELVANSLPGDVKPDEMVELIDDGNPKAKLLNDGNY